MLDTKVLERTMHENPLANLAPVFYYRIIWGVLIPTSCVIHWIEMFWIATHVVVEVMTGFMSGLAMKRDVGQASTRLREEETYAPRQAKSCWWASRIASTSQHNTGIIKWGCFLGGIKQCQTYGRFEGFPWTVHCLGCYCNMILCNIT